MRKLNLSFDIDDVIVDDTPIFKKAFKSTPHPFRYPTKPDFSDLPTEVLSNLFKLYSEPEPYLEFPLLDPRIPDALNNLIDSPLYNVSIVSQRPQEFYEMTLGQLQSYGINATPNMTILVGVFLKDGIKRYPGANKKIPILMERKIDLHFEDGALAVAACLQHNIFPVMISNHMTPFNHFLRNQAEHYLSLMDALVAKNLLIHSK